MTRTLRFLVACFAIMAGVMAMAQELPSAPHLTLMQRSTFILTEANRRVEIGLDATQQERVRKAVEFHTATQLKLMKAAEPDEKALAQADRDYADKVMSILNADQQKALLKLAVKESGVGILAEKEMADRLQLSADQLQKVRKLVDAMGQRQEDYEAMVGQGLDELTAPKKPSEQAAYEKKKAEVIKSYEAERKKMEADVADLEKQILAVLTDAQRKQWNALAG